MPLGHAGEAADRCNQKVDSGALGWLQSVAQTRPNPSFSSSANQPSQAISSAQVAVPPEVGNLRPVDAAPQPPSQHTAARNASQHHL